MNDIFRICLVSSICFALIIWPEVYLSRLKSSSAKELIERQPDLSSIDVDYQISSVVWLILSISLGVAASWYFNIQSGWRFYFLIVILFGMLALHQAIFAIVKGVYPVTKFLRYVSGKNGQIRSVAQLQVGIVSVVIAISALILAVQPK